MRVSDTCTICGKPRDPEIKTIAYRTEDDLSESISLIELPTHRAVFCSQECRVEFIEGMEPELTDDALLEEAKQFRKQ